MPAMAGERTVLVVEDEPSLREIVARYLESRGFSVLQAGNGEQALTEAARRPDLVVLDLILPGMNGMEVCRRLRGVSSTPIIMLTARAEERDRILGLMAGADDYIVKPFSLAELAARVCAVLRRSAAPMTPAPIGDMTLDPGARTLSRAGVEIPLTCREFDLLAHLAHHPCQALSRRELLDRVWGSASCLDPNTLSVHIRRLRLKIESDPDRPSLIQTVWGVGYKLVP